MSRSSLVTEEVSDWSEGSAILLGLLSFLKFLIDEISNKSFRFKLREIDITTSELLIVDDLSLHEIRKCDEEGITPWSQQFSRLAVIVVELVKHLHLILILHVLSENNVELLNQVLVG